MQPSCIIHGTEIYQWTTAMMAINSASLVGGTMSLSAIIPRLQASGSIDQLESGAYFGCSLPNLGKY